MANDLNRWESFSSIPDDYEQTTNESGHEDEFFSSSVNPSHPVKNLEALKSASNLAASFRKSQTVKAIDMPTKFLKPSEPDFSADPYD